VKKLKSKGGFTLVECVVAMAVLAIMSLLLMSILTITINARNNNQKLENDIDRQVDLIVENGADTAAYTSQIVFNCPDGAGVFTEAIPANGTDDIKAEKHYDADADAALGAIKYDFSNYKKFQEIKNGGGIPTTPTPSPSGIGKIYGAEKNEITVNESVIANIGEKKVTWTVNYNSAKPGAKEIAVKIILPAGWHNVSFGGSSAGKMLMIDENTVRIESGDASVNAAITFDISDDDYTAYGSLDKYFNNGTGTGNTITVNL
jgi:prepilin-type N-terminal cleavage/methylation domain-containing protein